MKEFNFEEFDSLRNERFVKFCEGLYEVLTNSEKQYFSQEELDKYLESQEIFYNGKYATVYKGERLFEKGYNKNVINLLNVFFNLYDKSLDIFILNEGSLIEIFPKKRIKEKKIIKRIMKIKPEKLKEIIDKEITQVRLQRK